jgi:hypothetical protein
VGFPGRLDRQEAIAKLHDLSPAVRPVARNESAIRAFHVLGSRILGGHFDLTMDLRPVPAQRRHGVTLHNRFD